ncbi:glycosyltransferase [Paenibacillus hodogayensis]|uniref:Glycosyltransferase n=1 Tax=Paenibacillus hodogayensis TaxID=279208 RepID=A0ABV5VT13_9BACL
MRKKRVLVASPVHQRPAVLQLFLESLSGLEQQSASVNFLFMDDNEDPISSALLRKFAADRGRTVVERYTEGEASAYSRDEYTHYWKEEQVWKVAGMKDAMLRHACDRKYDYIFLVDSDLVLHPRTLEQLLADNKEIVSGLFWTRWQPNTIEMPQVWVRDEYDMFVKRRHETVSEAEASARMTAFFDRLRKPGVYEVGGLGACTLISRKALQAGVKFAEIDNVSFWGEDRHFCIRARALGIGLHVDTHYPAFHIYRDSDIVGAREFRRRTETGAELGASDVPSVSDERPGISVSVCLIVKNEEDSLPHCLESVRRIADEIVIVDTGSTDRTKEVAASYTDCIYDFVWIDDFSAARNYAFSKATQSYVLWLDADDVLKERDQRLLAELKRTLDPEVDAVSMHYHLAFDEEGRVTQSLRRNRLVKRERHFPWIGPVHEYLAVGGNILHSEIAVTHGKQKAYTDRNLQIYRKRERLGEAFSPRDQYYFANELRDHAFYEEAAQQYETFLSSSLGWKEDCIAASMKLADCWGHLCERERQIAALLDSFDYDLPRSEICCQLGAVFLEENQLQQAAYWYRLATTLVPGEQQMGMIDHASRTWLPHLQLCLCLDRLGQREQAKLHNDIALGYNPTHPSMLHNKRYFEQAFGKQTS